MNETRAAAPFVSLVVATLGTTDVLELLLASLTALEEAPPFEVIVVDQNGDDRLDAAIARFSSRLTLIHEKVAFKGASRARNHGGNVARGEWLGFPDDDCQLRPDTLHRLQEAILSTGLRVVTGRTIDASGAPSVLRWGDVAERFDRWTMFRSVTECTLFVERALFTSVGGFDPNFGPGGDYPAAEGIDLVNRLLKTARSGYFSPAIEFVHASKIPPWNDWAVERFGHYAIGDGALIAKSPSLPLLYWGARTMLAALINLTAPDRHRRAAYAARLRGLVSGFARFRRAARQ